VASTADITGYAIITRYHRSAVVKISVGKLVIGDFYNAAEFTFLQIFTGHWRNP